MRPRQRDWKTTRDWYVPTSLQLSCALGMNELEPSTEKSGRAGRRDKVFCPIASTIWVVSEPAHTINPTEATRYLRLQESSQRSPAEATQAEVRLRFYSRELSPKKIVTLAISETSLPQHTNN